MHTIHRALGSSVQAPGGWGRLLPGMLAVVLGLVLSITGFLVLRGSTRRAAEERLVRNASAIATQISSSFRSPIETLHAIDDFQYARGEIDQHSFRRFVGEALERNPAITSLEWVERVSASEREALVARARGQGMRAYAVRELTPEGSLTIAAIRDEHYPILYMESLDEEGPGEALGFDLTSEAQRRRLVHAARDTGEAMASAPFVLVEDPAEIYSIALYLPVYRRGAPLDTVEARRGAIEGLAIAIFRLPRIIERALRGADVGLDLVLVDITDGPQGQLLYETKARAHERYGRAALRHETTIDFAGRRWALRFVSDEAVPISLGAWLVLLGGLVLSVALGVALTTTRQVQELRREVLAARQLGQYTIQERIGHGGMGIVYKARHAMLRRPTAIKVLRDEADEHTMARFEREVQLTSQLAHPNIIAVFDYGRTPEGDFYYAMEYLEGVTLSTLIKEDGPQPAGRVIHLLRQACDALAAAHEIGLIHRDIKPANIMITGRSRLADHLKVLDFGLAKDISTGASGEAELTHGRTIIGTPLYLSPEAIEDPSKVDGRSDLYALACVAYYLLTGEHLYDADLPPLQVCFKHTYEEPVPPSMRLGKPLPRVLEGLIMRCLAKNPLERPESAGALADALESLTHVKEIKQWTRVDAFLWWSRWNKSHPEGALTEDERAALEEDARAREAALEGGAARAAAAVEEPGVSG